MKCLCGWWWVRQKDESQGMCVSYEHVVVLVPKRQVIMIWVCEGTCLLLGYLFTCEIAWAGTSILFKSGICDWLILVAFWLR